MKPSWLHISQPLSPPPNWMCSVNPAMVRIKQLWAPHTIKFKLYKMESDVYVGYCLVTMWRVWVSQTSRERKIRWYTCLCFPQSDQIFNISLPATSEGQIVPTVFGLVWVRFWFRIIGFSYTLLISTHYPKHLCQLVTSLCSCIKAPVHTINHIPMFSPCARQRSCLRTSGTKL